MNVRYQKFAEKFISFSLFILLFWAAQTIVSAQPPKTESPLERPANGGRVGDFAGVIDAATRERLETKLKKLRDTTNPPIEMGVAIVQSTEGQDPFDYSLKVARGWGIGTKEQDNAGLLLFVSIGDRKYFTQISRDLEGDLTDGEAGQIQRNVLVPAFRAGNYAKGVEDTLDAYIQNIAQSRGFDASQITGATPTRPPPRSEQPRSRQPRAQLSTGACCIGLIIIFIILFIISAGRRRGGGGGWGGGGGLLEGLILGSILSNVSRGDGWSGGSFGGSGGSDSGGDSGWGGFGGGGDFGGGGGDF